MSSSGGRTGSGEDVQRGDSNKSGDSSSETSVSSATSGRGRKKGKTVSLADFHIQYASQSAVSAPSRQSRTADPSQGQIGTADPSQGQIGTADPSRSQTKPVTNLKSNQEYPVLGASSGSSSRQQNVHTAADYPDQADVSGSLSNLKNLDAAADPGQLDQQKAREELAKMLVDDHIQLDRLTRLKAHEDLMEELASKGNARLAAENNQLKKDFAHLLQNYEIKGSMSYYGCKALAMVPMEDYTFTVNFKHILGQGYIDLALNIMKKKDADNSHGWLLGTTVNFLRTQRQLANDELQGVILEFENLPLSMKSFSQYAAAELVQRDTSPFGLKHNLVAPIFLGRQIYINGQKHMLESHSVGKSWGGLFEENDIYVIMFSRTSISCYIRESVQKLVCSPENRVLDLKMMHQIMVAKYQFEGYFPPHFDCLENDMRSLDVATIDKTSILEYLPFHVAIMPLAATEYITEKLHKATESVWIPPQEYIDYVNVFEKIPKGSVDWRERYCDSESQDELLKAVYKHDGRSIQQIMDKNFGLVQDKTSNAEVQNMSSNVLQDSSSSSAASGNTSFNVLQDSSNSSAAIAKSKFKRSKKGKLAFKRHLDVHLHSHMAGKRPLKGMFQAEAYSSKNNSILGEIFTDLFSGPSMKLENFLRPVMVHYRHLRDMDDE